MVKKNALTPEEETIILHKGTEAPFSGEYEEHYEEGVYLCKQCDAPLFNSNSKFDAQCGWPSFDDAIAGALKEFPDADGMRTEIVCAACDGHLGHVFHGEQYTPKDARYCMNSIALKFKPVEVSHGDMDWAVFASGCYWGTEHWFAKQAGVISTEVGYAGGEVRNPSYGQVCSGSTGHAESVRVKYDPNKTTYADLVKLFFETHDPTQKDGQGPDIGTQYRSVIFYENDAQKKIAEKYRQILIDQGLDVVTKIEPLENFFRERDEMHQKYYEKTGKSPYCHFYTKRF